MKTNRSLAAMSALVLVSMLAAPAPVSSLNPRSETHAGAATLNLSSGAAWLSAQQTPGGAWTASSTLAVRDTATAVSALLLAGGHANAVTAGTAWLKAAQPYSTDLLARDISALALAGDSDPVMISALAARQLPDGSWGFDATSSTGDAYDTALALLALAPSYQDFVATGTSPVAGFTLKVYRGLSYLMAFQYNGAWSLTPGLYTVQATSIGLLALAQYRGLYGVSAPVNLAMAYLKAAQYPDGSISDAPGAITSVEDTALAHAALWAAGSTDAASLLNARAYLGSQQSVNGSWNNEIYATSLALQALTQISATQVNGIVLDDASAAPIQNATVSAIGFGSISANTNSAGAFTLIGLPPGNRQLTVNAPGYLGKALKVTLTAGTAVNSGAILLTSQAPVPSFTYSPANPVVGQSVVFTSTSIVYNLASPIVAYDWSTSAGDFSSSVLPGLNPIFTTQFLDGGAYTVTLRLRDSHYHVRTVSQAVAVANVTPVVSIVPALPVTISVGVPITLTGVVTSPSPIALASMNTQWNLGIFGLTYPGHVVSYTWPAPGLYTVTLSALDKNGLTASASSVISVVANPAITTFVPITSLVAPAPLLAFSLITGAQCPQLPPHEGDTCTFDPGGSSANDGSGFAYMAWNWQDGSASAQTGSGPMLHRFTDSGAYFVHLTGQTGNGLTGTVAQLVTVANVTPTVNAGNQRLVPANRDIILQATAFDPGLNDARNLQFLWDFGDGQQASPVISSTTGNLANASVVHQWAAEGAYTITVTATDPHGATGTASVVYIVGTVKPPVVTSQPPVYATVGVPYQYAVHATDPNGFAMTYLLSYKPAGMTINASGVISWTPAADQVGVVPVYVLVIDTAGGGVIHFFNITVNPAPVVPSAADQSMFRPDLVPLTLDASNVVFDPQNARVTGTLTATLQNIGLISTTVPFSVTFFDDTDGNGAYTPGVDTVFADGTVSGAIGVGQVVTFSAAVRAQTFSQFPGSLVYVMVDSTNAIDEGPTGKLNNVRNSGYAARYVPPAGLFNPYVKWSFQGLHPGADSSGAYVNNIGAVAPLIDTNGDGVIDKNDNPAIVFNTSEYLAAGAARSDVVWAVRGDTGQEICHVAFPDNEFGEGVSQMAVGDIDGSGKPALIVVNTITPPTVRAFNNDCSLRWTGQAPTATVGTGYAGAPTLADLDGDGKSEIIYSNAVWNSDGTLRWVGATATSTSHYCCYSSVGDLNGDGKLEIVVNGVVAYRADGTVLWDRSADLPPSYQAIADIDGNGTPEIVTVATDWEGVRLLNHDGTTRWGPILIPGGGGGSPVVADFMGNGTLDIGVAGATNFVVLDGADGHIVWQRGIHDASYASGASAFDFDGNGIPDIVYRDEYYLYILRGNDGAVLWQTPNPSATTAEYPVIADVDGDGHAEIVVSRDQYFGQGNAVGVNDGGIFVYGDALNNWRPARSVWNQFDYHVTNVDDNGRPQGGAARGNPYAAYANRSVRQQVWPSNIDPFAAPDAVAAALQFDASGCPTALGLRLRIANAGSAPMPKGAGIGFYNGSIAPANRIATTNLSSALQPGKAVDAVATWASPPGGTHTVVAFVDDPSAAPFTTPEANKTNNVISRTLVPCDGSNLPPAFTSSPVITATAGAVYQYGATASDPNSDALTFGLLAGPAGLFVQPASGLVRWATQISDIGSVPVTLMVSDGRGGIATQSFTITVAPPSPSALAAQCTTGGGGGTPVAGVDPSCVSNTAGTVAPGAVTASIVTDKASYTWQDSAQLLSRIQNPSLSLTYAGLTATVNVRNSGNAVINSFVHPLGPIGPGSYVKVSDIFDTGSQSPGNYTAEVIVTYGAVTIASATTPLSVLSDANAVVRLSGTLTPSLSQIGAGQGFSVSWSATNFGSGALSGVTFSLIAVDPVSGTVRSSYSEVSGIGQSQTINRISTLASPNTHGPILLVLLGNTQGVTETLATGGIIAGGNQWQTFVPMVLR